MDEAQSNEVAVRHFRDGGVEIDDAIEVLAGLHPWALLTPGSLTTWTRVLARRGDSLQLWTAWTGFTPRKLLATFPMAGLHIVSEGRLYDRVDLGGRYTVRVRRGDRYRLHRWLART